MTGVAGVPLRQLRHSLGRRLSVASCCLHRLHSWVALPPLLPTPCIPSPRASCTDSRYVVRATSFTQVKVGNGLYIDEALFVRALDFVDAVLFRAIRTREAATELQVDKWSTQILQSLKGHGWCGGYRRRVLADGAPALFQHVVFGHGFAV